MSAKKSKQPILIIEDSDDDFEATERAFIRVGNLANPLVRCIDGSEALQFLQTTLDSNKDMPGIILLDLNLPGLDGRDVLREIKSNSKLKNIPVVILTTSDDERDIASCYEAGANTYIRKPVNIEGFFEAVQKLKDYWFEIAVLPKDPRYET